MYASLLMEEAGPNTELGWLLYLFLGVFRLMVVVGWWVGRRNGTAVEVQQEMYVLHHETPAVPGREVFRQEQEFVCRAVPLMPPIAVPARSWRSSPCSPRV